ncbi:MAG TPA: magnesium transporter, partial [Thermoanaerobaculia bacterium]|nr:magnesium transporter [Thermoanaerobaculia bacterium]
APVMDPATARKTEHLRDTLRRFVRRGARSSISKLLVKVRPEDVAMLLRGLTPSERLAVFRIVTRDFPDEVGDVLTELEPHQRNDLLEQVGPEEVAEILERVPVDDAVFVIESMTGELQQEVLALVDLHGSAEVQAQLTYEDDTAGRIMTREYFSLPASTRVRDAIAAIQENRDVELIFYLYVVDDDGRLAGVTSLRQLLLAPPSQTLGEIAQHDVIQARTHTDQEEVAQVAARYDLLAIPVTDDEDRLVGIVTVDDIVDIVKEEATEDFLKMVGTSEDEIVHQERSLKVAGIRLPWLLINMVGLVISGLLLDYFAVTFKEQLFLITFVPVIMGMGGNSGSQTSTITVRGIATGRLHAGHGRIGHFLWQQVKVGLVLGVVLASIIALVATFLPRGKPEYALVVSVSLFCAVLAASLLGTLIPLIAERINVDPAVASGPMVTTGNDLVGLLIYFGCATLMIRYMIH